MTFLISITPFFQKRFFPFYKWSTQFLVFVFVLNDLYLIVKVIALKLLDDKRFFYSVIRILFSSFLHWDPPHPPWLYTLPVVVWINCHCARVTDLSLGPLCKNLFPKVQWTPTVFQFWRIRLCSVEPQEFQQIPAIFLSCQKCRRGQTIVLTAHP